MNNLKITLLISLVLLQSCSSALHDKCSYEKWDAVGLSLGQEGSNYKENDYIKSCQNIGVNPDLEKLEKGYNEGLVSYCDPQKFRLSAELGDVLLDSICPITLSKSLQKESKIGLKKHCTKEGAHARGLANKLNKDVCPVKFKQTYKKFYSVGLRKYLNLYLAKSKLRSAQIQKRVSEIDLKLHQKQGNLNSVRDYENRKNSKSNQPNDLEKVVHLFDSSPETLESEIQNLNQEKGNLLKENVNLNQTIAVEELRLRELEVEIID